MFVPALCVVRFASTGVREYHKLCFAIPRFDGSLVRLIYIEYEDECAPDILHSSSWQVDVQTMMSKDHVRHTAERDVGALRDKLPEYEDVRRCSRHVTWPRTSVCHIVVPHHAPHLMSQLMSLCVPLRSSTRSSRISHWCMW